MKKGPGVETAVEERPGGGQALGRGLGTLADR